MSFNRQIFTLFHELYHLTQGISGIDKIEDDYIACLDNGAARIEIECNVFASEFLLPADDFSSVIMGKEIDYTVIEKLSSHYKVSRQVIMLRLLKMDKISQDFYDAKKEEIETEYRRTKTATKGGNYYATHISYLGNQYLNRAFDMHSQSRIDRYQLANYTKTKIENLGQLYKHWRGFKG